MRNKFLALLTLLALPVLAFAEDTLNTGDTAWMMVSTAFVLLMTPAGLALFYAGMTRSKNTLNTFTMVMGAFVLAFVVWIVAGYSIAFGASENATIQMFAGGFNHLFLSGVNWTDLSGSYPTYVFIAFQGTFAAITVAIAAGSIIGRMKFSTWMVIVALWGVIVYAPVAHLVWGGDGALLFDAGALDFAGGTVVHMNGGLAGLVLAILVGKRMGYPTTAMKPFSIILTAVGAALLWFGWYGFNGGSAFGAILMLVKSFFTGRKHKKELADYKNHLERQMKITDAGNNKLVQELEQIKKENENLRISVQTLNQKPGRAELRLLNIYDAALRKMMAQAPGFSTAWENSLQEAEREYEANESGLKSIVSKVFGSGTPVNTDGTNVQQIEHK